MEKLLTFGEFTFLVDEDGGLWLEHKGDILALAEEVRERFEEILGLFWEETA